MIKAALFDLDGVVFDTEPQYTKFWGEQMRMYHPEQPGLEQRVKGMTLVQVYDLYFAGRPDVQDEITRRLNDFELHMDYIYVKGFEVFIMELRGRSVKTAVVTSSNREKMENVYRCHPEFKSYFDAILTGEDYERSKPDPDPYLKGAARLGVEPKLCAGFEDSVNGLKAVQASGMLNVGLTTTNSKEVVTQWADVVIDDFSKLDISTLDI